MTKAERPWIIRPTELGKTASNAGVDRRYARAITVIDADIPAYEQTVIDSKAGTRVPRASQTGGVAGSINPYGTVVVGQHITAGPNGQEQHLGEVIPAFVRTLGEAPDGSKPFAQNTAAALAVIQSQNPRPEAPAEDVSAAAPRRRKRQTRQEKNGASLQELLREQDAEEGVGMPDLPRSWTPAPVAAQPVPRAVPNVLNPHAPVVKPDKPLIRASISGPFGSYKGFYTEIVVTPETVVLMYKDGDSVFTPPVSEAELTISCDREKYAVYFAGIEFTIPSISQGIQVFIRV